MLCREEKLKEINQRSRAQRRWVNMRLKDEAEAFTGVGAQQAGFSSTRRPTAVGLSDDDSLLVMAV